MPRGVDGSTPSQSSSMCVAQAPAHMHAMRVTGRRAAGGEHAGDRGHDGDGDETVRDRSMEPANQQIEVGGDGERGAGEREAVSRPGVPRARSGAALQARFPGNRSAAQATAIPARAWPIGLGMRAPIIADSANRPNRGESDLVCKQLILQCLTESRLHVLRLTFARHDFRMTQLRSSTIRSVRLQPDRKGATAWRPWNASTGRLVTTVRIARN